MFLVGKPNMNNLKKLNHLIFMFFIFSILSTSYANSLHSKNLQAIAEEVYIYAYPLVVMDVTKAVMTNVLQPQPNNNPRAPVNQLVSAKSFPDPNFKDIIRPNVDTLYTVGWLDLRKEPIILSVPNTNNHYYLLPLMDAWTEIFASPGTRTAGNQAKKWLIVGPNWKKPLPKGVNVIQSPTDDLWIIGRVQANSTEDYPAVHAIQQQFKLTPLSQLENTNDAVSVGKVNASIDMKTPPPEQVAKMDALTFFARFANALMKNPPHADDKRIIEKMKLMGITPGKRLNLNEFNQDQIITLNAAQKSAFEKIKNSGIHHYSLVNGWHINNKDVGIYGTDYLKRAVIAMYALGANLLKDAMYISLRDDQNNHPLSGKYRYVLHFKRGQTPPVRAFWSLTLYDSSGYLVPNKIDRYAIGDKNRLTFNEDGSLNIYIQHDKPDDDKVSNWLPSPEGDFNLLLRLYWPEYKVIAKGWKPPLIKTIE